MPFAILLIAAGGVMIYSALKGISIADAFNGVTGAALDPSGGNLTPAAPVAPADPATPDDPAAPGPTTTEPDPGSGTITRHGLKGPNAAKLEALANVAERDFSLTVGSVCRSAAHNAAVGGSKTSFHLQCRAFDSTGSVTKRVAFARFAKAQLAGVSGAEVFCDQAGMIAPGFDHSDHVHVGA